MDMDMDMHMDLDININIRRASAQGVSDHGLCALDIAIFRNSAMQTNSNSTFEHKTRVRTTIVGICARTNVSGLRNEHARGAVRGVWERAIFWNFRLVKGLGDLDLDLGGTMSHEPASMHQISSNNLK